MVEKIKDIKNKIASQTYKFDRVIISEDDKLKIIQSIKEGKFIRNIVMLSNTALDLYSNISLSLIEELDSSFDDIEIPIVLSTKNDSAQDIIMACFGGKS